MARYILEDGEETTADDPARLVWYSARCFYWSDDWASLSKSFEVPLCPGCSSPGYMSTAEAFFKGASDFAETEAKLDRYVDFLKSSKETCSQSDLVSLYQIWLAAQN